jgi:ECF transporter S component (folate family)
MPKVKKIVLGALLLAVLIIFERLVSVHTPVLRVSFAYVPIMLSGIFLGPAFAGGIAALGDVIGALLFPKGAFFPGYTLSALLTGVIYGLFLYRTKSNRAFLARLIIANALVLVFIHTGLTSLWIAITLKRAFSVFAAPRIVSAALLFPIQVSTMYFLKITLADRVVKLLGLYDSTSSVEVEAI